MTFDTATFWSAFGVLAAISISFIGIRAQQDGLMQPKSSRRGRHDGAYRKLVGVFIIAVSASGLLAFALTASGLPKAIKAEVVRAEAQMTSGPAPAANETPAVDGGPQQHRRQGMDGADPAISPSAVIIADTKATDQVSAKADGEPCQCDAGERPTHAAGE